MRLIDLSRSLFDHMPVYPSDGPTRLFQDRRLREDHYNNFRLDTGMHAGTHVDSPMHLTDSPRFIEDLPLDRFTGNGCLLDVRGEKTIGCQDDYATKVKAGDIVLCLTGHGREFGKEGYFRDYPVIDPALAEFLVAKKIKMLGIDSPSPDNPPFPVHQLLFSNNILILENLTNLEALASSASFQVIALPLKLKADSSPVRAAALVSDEAPLASGPSTAAAVARNS